LAVSARWGLVRHIFDEQLLIDLPSYGEISANDLRRVVNAIEKGKDAEVWKEVTAPKPFDVVLMNYGTRSYVGHVGVVLPNDSLIHADLASNVAVIPLDHILVVNRIMGFRRHICLL
jgi:cell wall-associated NlpC family hydrolase